MEDKPNLLLGDDLKRRIICCCVVVGAFLVVVSSYSSFDDSVDAVSSISPSETSMDEDLCWSSSEWPTPAVDIEYITTQYPAYIEKKNPPTEWLLLRLIPNPCSYEENVLLFNVMAGLSHDDADYVTKALDWHHVERFEANVDQDGENEIVLFGGGSDFALFAGVLDWDSERWQVSWFSRIGTRYSGKFRVQLDDFDNDSRDELLLEALLHPCSGTGILCQSWRAILLECEHLHCNPEWTHEIASIGRMGGYYSISNEYRFLESSHLNQADIEVVQYGIEFNWLTDDREMPLGLSSIDVLTRTRMIYWWNGVEYTQAMSTVIASEYSLSTQPITRTVDFDSDGLFEYAVYDWTSSGDQVVSVYRDIDSQLQLVRVFTATVTGSPDTGVFVRDADEDGLLEVAVCQTSFELIAWWDDDAEWPSLQSDCESYEWNAASSSFQPLE